jgi:hypothetical protein
MTKRILKLTPNEEARTEKAAFSAWMAKAELYSPPPEPVVADLVSDNRRVMNILIALVGWLPLILAIIGLAAAVVSMDKTSAAFAASVAHKGGLWGAWTYIVALAAVVMVDLALVVSEFAMVRDMLRKGLHRQVWTIGSTWRAIKVRLGLVPALDFSEMPDQSLRFYSQFLFALIVASNVYAVIQVGHIKSLSDLDFETGLLLFTGIAGALSLRFLGQQLSHIVYDMAAEKREMERRELYSEWREDLTRIWAEEGGKIVAQALHARFLQKNGLDAGTDSPYLLMPGAEEGGEHPIQAVPLVRSSEPSPTPSKSEWSPSSNGNRETTA